MGLDALAMANYLNLVTYRKSGVEVATPVWFAEEGGDFYIFSEGRSGKVKRLRNSGKSRIAACTVTGRPTGDWVDTQTVILEDAAGRDRALDLLRRKYGWQMRLLDCMSRLGGKMKKRAYLRVTPR